MGYYPIFLNLVGRRCVIIGGGAVAERKVDTLLGVGATVTIVSPSLTERLESWVREGHIKHVGRDYRPGDLAGYELAFVATDDREVNAVVASEGRERGVWVNAADDPAHCDFILPSVLRRGDLVVAVATGGLSPALSRAIREELEDYFTEDYTLLAKVVSEVREELKQNSSHPDAETWRKALNGDLRRIIKDGNKSGAKAYLLKRLGVERCK
ncbi:MAG: precorrin-2 dehydrogenase/sirohydrochlorin ferrochelatase family protein [Candidatus Binatia bacterium]